MALPLMLLTSSSVELTTSGIQAPPAGLLRSIRAMALNELPSPACVVLESAPPSPPHASALTRRASPVVAAPAVVRAMARFLTPRMLVPKTPPRTTGSKQNDCV